MKTNGQYREQAREVLKNNWALIILLSLIASLPNILSQVINIRVNLSFTDVLYRAVLTGSVTDMTGLTKLWNDFVSTLAGPQIMAIVLMGLSFLLSPVLNIGLCYHALKLVRHQETEVTDIIARVGIFLKAVLMQIIRAVLVTLWMLVAVAVMTVLMLMAVRANSMPMLMIVSYAGTGLSLFFVIRAILTYFYADYFLAENPTVGALQSIRLSKRMVFGNRARLCTLLCFFVLLDVLATMVTSFLSGPLTFIGAILSMAVQLVINAYMAVTAAAYFEDLRNEMRRKEM